MGKYLKRFATVQEYEAATIYRPNVSYIDETSGVTYNPVQPAPPVVGGYFTIIPNDSLDLSFDGNITLYYSTDSGTTWEEFTGDTFSSPIWLKGVAVELEDTNIGSFSANFGEFDVEGNIMSLVFGDNFSGQTDLTGYDYIFSRLFEGCPIVNASGLTLPATTLSEWCYESMFDGCTSLVTVPELPASTLSSNCYNHMFSGCYSLTTAPELSATTLADGCYDEMFYSCTSLTTAPELPATTLADGCYKGMFSECESLTTAPELPATTLTYECYDSMFNSCYSLETAPELPATTLPEGCYRSMFSSCSSLSAITCLAIDISEMDCTDNWVNGVAATGTFTKDPTMSDWMTDTSGIPDGWTVEDYNV